MTFRFLQRDHLQHLVSALQQDGYRVVGPREKHGTIVYDELNSVDELPQGVGDRQSPAGYRLEKNRGARYFAWANGPQAIKPLVFRSRESLWHSVSDETNKVRFQQVAPAVQKTAVIAARACDLAALALQDQHFIHGEYTDPYYTARRENLFIIAVNCTHPADTCFCASTGDGPEARSGFDLVLTELDDGFLIDSGSDLGGNVMQRLELEAVSDKQLDTANQQTKMAASVQKRKLPDRDLRHLLADTVDNPRWDEVARRCLSCGNCTSVCPTCFCHSEHEQVTLDGMEVSHYRQWSSCFTRDHSYMHGIVVRPDTRMRYRQWLTHKLGSWHDQYGRSGCVGCGRCITWCPAGIDITQEVHAVCEVSDA